MIFLLFHKTKHFRVQFSSLFRCFETLYNRKKQNSIVIYVIPFFLISVWSHCFLQFLACDSLRTVYHLSSKLEIEILKNSAAKRFGIVFYLHSLSSMNNHLAFVLFNQKKALHDPIIPPVSNVSCLNLIDKIKIQSKSVE